jgi:hypothetical protein
MTLLGQGVEVLSKEEFEHPTGNFGETLNRFIADETGRELEPTEIDMFNNWPKEELTGWQDFVDWLWYQIRRFIEWLFDLL